MAYLIEGTEYPVLYLANYRVGSTATAATLMDMGAQQLNGHHGLPKYTPPNALVVQTVRHHCDVIVSQWCNINCKIPIQDLIDSIIADENHYFPSAGFYKRHVCNYIMRYETLQYEFDNLCLCAGLEGRILKIDPSKRPSSKTWQSVLTSDQIEQICKHYKEEMDFYGYSAKGNFPEELDGSLQS